MTVSTMVPRMAHSTAPKKVETKVQNLAVRLGLMMGLPMACCLGLMMVRNLQPGKLARNLQRLGLHSDHQVNGAY